jgi:ABC-type molybdate transport system ATPase subunit
LCRGSRDGTGNDSRVIALYGFWGSGKTSVKNMAIETFLSSKGNCSLILEENDLKEFDSLKSLS